MGMKDFLYLCIDAKGNRVAGEMESNDAEKVKSILHKKGLTIISIDKVKPKHWIWYLVQPVKPQLLALWIRQLAVMLQAGIALAQAMHSLLPKAGNQHYKRSMERMLVDVENGYSLSQAMIAGPSFSRSS
jgi:type II secretory pathway component PulF